MFVAGGVCYHDNSKSRASIFTKLGLYSVGKASDHLQLIKFWLSCAPGRGSAVVRKFLAPPYYSQYVMFVSLSTYSFFHCKIKVAPFLIPGVYVAELWLLSDIVCFRADIKAGRQEEKHTLELVFTQSDRSTCDAVTWCRSKECREELNTSPSAQRSVTSVVHGR